MENFEKELMRPGGTLIRSEENKTKELPLQKIVELSGLSSDQINPLIYDQFTEPSFVAAIPESIKNDPAVLANWLKNSSLFADLVGRDSRKILGDVIKLPESQHADGRERRAEEGPEVLVNKIKEEGVDLNGVLFFRRTLLANETSKPESYWTSDYWETVRGLSVEIAGEQREKTKILCSTLQDLSSDSRLVTDINDDNGLSVRRESLEAYDQKRVLFVI